MNPSKAVWNRNAGCRRAQRGFSLIELMIAVAVVAILAAVALPAYTEHIRKSRRADAQSFLAHVVARQQQFFLDQRAFAVNITNSPAAGGLGLSIPANVSAHYSISMAAVNTPPPTFTLTATPTGAQAAEPCGVLTITHTGAKTAAGTGNCW
jgi:type IV pilus assembly protein PilE